MAPKEPMHSPAEPAASATRGPQPHRRERAAMSSLEITRIRSGSPDLQSLQRLAAAPGATAADAELPAEDVLPFEFKALEAILEASIGRLEIEWKQLAAIAYPALDQLTKKVTTSCLNLVRSIKSRMTHLTSRVQKVRDELEQLLDDDQDMADMYLSRRLAWLRMPDSPPGSVAHSFRGSVAWRGESVASMAAGGRVSAFFSSGMGGLANATNTMSILSTVAGGSEVEELEMLLEAYFTQAEGVLNELRELHEYVDDTEDYVNMYLDNHRNLLQGVNVLLTAGGTILAFVLVFLGLYSMNVANPLYEVEGIFTEIMVSLLAICLALFGAFCFYAWRSNMVTFPDQKKRAQPHVREKRRWGMELPTSM